MLASLGGGADLALGLFQTEELSRCDVAVFGPGDRVEGIAVKPERPPSDWIWSCAAARVRALADLAHHDEPGALFDRLCRRGRVVAVRLSDEFIDIGTPEALVRARGEGAAAEGQERAGTADRQPGRGGGTPPL